MLYDDNASLHAARVWWVFEHFGHREVRVVDGGLNAWLHEGRALTSEVPRPEPARFEPRVDDAAHCLLEDLRAIVEAGPEAGAGPQIWDTRSDGEWTGENDRGNERAGHVPGAKHLEWVTLMDGGARRGASGRWQRFGNCSSGRASTRRPRPSRTDRAAFGPRSRPSSCGCSGTIGCATTTDRWASGRTARTRR